MKLSQIPTPTLAELLAEFRFISQSTFDGVPGVFDVDSGRSGGTVGITLHTHGNEPAGLATLWYMRAVLGIERLLKQGRVLFVLNNIEATRAYLRARTPRQKKAARFLELNMNRLPEGLRFSEDAYEIRRARELLPVWRQFDAALDIHSLGFRGTARECRPMIIEVTSNRRIARLIRRFPINLRFTHVEQFQLRKPMLSFCGNPAKRIPAVGIEAGSHESPTAFRNAIACVFLFLKAHDMLDCPLKLPSPPKRRGFRFIGRLDFPDNSWELVRIFRPYERVVKGEVLARNGSDGVLRSPMTGYIVFPPEGRKPAKHGDEVFFFAKRL